MFGENGKKVFCYSCCCTVLLLFANLVRSPIDIWENSPELVHLGSCDLCWCKSIRIDPNYSTNHWVWSIWSNQMILWIIDSLNATLILIVDTKVLAQLLKCHHLPTYQGITRGQWPYKPASKDTTMTNRPMILFDFNLLGIHIKESGDRTLDLLLHSPTPWPLCHVAWRSLSPSILR